MRKGIYLLTTLFLLLTITSCRRPTTENKIEIINMSSSSSETYYAYIESSSINLNDYVRYSEEYQIVYNETVYFSINQTVFEIENNYATFYINSDYESYRLDFYKNMNVLVTFVFPNEYEIVKEVLLGSGFSNELTNEIQEYASLLGYSWSYYVDYECDDSSFENVLLDQLLALSDMTVKPALVPCENIITIDGKEYLIKTGDVIDVEVEGKEGYQFVGFTNGLNNGDIYYKTLGNTFNSVYQPNTYNLTLKYLDQTTQVEQIYNDPIILEPIKIDGYDFKGWFYNGVVFDKDKYDIPSDITLIAELESISYTLRFTNIDVPYEVDVRFNDLFTLPVPTKEGFNFVCWEYNGKKFEEGRWNYLEDIELVARWQEVQADVTLNLEAFGGAVNNIASVDVNNNIILPKPIKDGYNFVGWYYDINLEEKVESIIASEYNNQLLYAKYTYNSPDIIGEVTVTRINEHASNYDELAMFDSSKSGFTSKYWHKIGITKTEDSYVVSSIAINGESLSSLGEYDYVVLAYTSYPSYSSFVKLEYTIGTKVVFTIDPDLLEDGHSAVQLSFVKPNISEDIDLVRNELSLLYQDITTVSNDLDLVTSVLNYHITWHSSNRDAITPTGKYIKPYVTREVTMSAYIGDTFIYSFTVKAIGEKETSDALSTGYIYTPYDITQNAMNTLDIIYTAFLEIDANGDWTNYTRMKGNLNTHILPKAKISGTKVVVSVNQKSSGNFSNVAKSAELRAKLASKILDFIIEFDLDGIDIDWETPSSNEAENFTLLMKDIYEKVKGYDSTLLVTAAIGGGMWAPPKYDLPNSKQYLDYINLMTYSMAQSNGYYQNSLYKSTSGATLISCSIEESIEIYNDLGVENNKILLGIPFYTTVQTNSGGPGSKTGDGQSVWYDVMLEKYPLSDTMKEYFDDECGVPYRYDSVNKIFISYDNEQSIKIKCDYINTLGLAGIMYWQYGQDVDDMLTNAIEKYINK